MIKNKNQIEFFNKQSFIWKNKKFRLKKGVFDSYAYKFIIQAFIFLKESNTILDYGCGTGTMIDIFSSYISNKKTIVGVDIADNAISVVKEKYPRYLFFNIETEFYKIEKMKFDGIYLINVLHHATNHKKIIETVSHLIEKNGKFVIIDLSSNNILISFARIIFPFVPNFIKSKFSGDLYCNGEIPEKIKVSPSQIKFILEKEGFKIISEEYSYLFVFVVEWLNHIFRFDKFVIGRRIIQGIMKLEDILIKRVSFFKSFCEVFMYKCIKIK